MRPITILLLGTLASSAEANKTPPEPPVPDDISAAKADLRVIHDGKGHYVALVPPYAKSGGKWRFAYYGDDKALYALRSAGFSAQGTKVFDYSFWDPRIVRPGVRLRYANGEYTIKCTEQKVVLTELPEDKRKAFIDKAKFYRPLWSRRGHALARDERGRYYYVDVHRSKERSRDFRLYIGVAGRMKLQRMKNIVADSAGEIFSTPRGSLRMVLGKDEAVWIRGKRRTKLLRLPLWENARLIYTDLGVYRGKRLGTPCDDL